MQPNAPYNPYGQPPGRPMMMPGQPQQPAQQPQAPAPQQQQQPPMMQMQMQPPRSGSGSFRPFNPATLQGPLSGNGRNPPLMRGPARPMSGPLSTGARPMGLQSTMGMQPASGPGLAPGLAPVFGAGPRGLMPTPGSAPGPAPVPAPGAPPAPMQSFPNAMMRGMPTNNAPGSGRGGPPMAGMPMQANVNAPPAPGGPPVGFPPRVGPSMMMPPPQAGGAPAFNNANANVNAARGTPPPAMGMAPPPGANGPPTGEGLASQFGQMRVSGGPPMAGAAQSAAMPPPPAAGMGQGPPFGMRGPTPPGPPMAGAPPMPGAPPMQGAPPMPGAPPMAGAPPMGNRYGAPGMPNAMAPGQPPMQPQGPNALPSGNFQQPTDMMDGYGQKAVHGSQTPQLSDELMASQCDPKYMRMTVSMIPYSRDHTVKSGLTCGVILQPMAPQTEETKIPDVNFGPSGVVRCRHCRTYVNPFVQWVDNGRRWRCNICGVSNDVPSSYFCHLNANGQRQDRDEHPELSCGSIEIIAPSEYMMRPPQPPCYMFVIDVSAQAMSSGAVQIAVETIKQQLDNLPGAPRTRVGFLTYDHSIHFYNLKPTLKTPQMMVIADLDELFIPIPDELLVNLSESREVIDALLDALPTIHQNARSSETALGPAIRVAFKLMSSIGGKMLVFQSSLPSAGVGALRNRENPRLMGSDKEHTLLSMADTFYRSNAIDCCRQQISVDTFLFSPTYTDVATLSTLSRFSAGQLYYYPAFDAARDGTKFSKELAHCLARETGWEAVVRVRSTKGTRLTSYFGSHFLRGPDLLATPTINADASFAIELTHSDTLFNSSTLSVQAAVLYTNSAGERRIRVHTLCVPVTKLYAEIFRSVDVDSLCNIMAKNALEVALKTGLDSARTQLQNQCVEIVRAYRTCGTQGGNSGYQTQLPESLQLLPLYVMALLKNAAFRGGTDLSADERAFHQYRLYNMPNALSRVCIYPRMFALHTMPPEAGLPAPEESPEPLPTSGAQRIVLPPLINLSIERLMCEGVFMLEDATAFYLWVGRSVPAPLLQSLFGLDSLDGVDCKQIQLLAPHDDFSKRVDNILNSIREERLPYMDVVIMREGDPSEGRFFWKLVEDRASFPGGSYSYQEYLNQIMRLSLGGR